MHTYKGVLKNFDPIQEEISKLKMIRFWRVSRSEKFSAPRRIFLFHTPSFECKFSKIPSFLRYLDKIILQLI